MEVKFSDAVTGKLLADVVDVGIGCTDAPGETGIPLLRIQGEKTL